MSIEWRLYQAELQVQALTNSVAGLTHELSQDEKIFELQQAAFKDMREQRDAAAQHAQQLMAQNDGLSDRIHLDLDPRIKMMQSNIDTLRLDRDAMENKLSDLHEVLIR